MVDKVVFQGCVKWRQAQKLSRVHVGMNREGDIELGEKGEKKKETIAKMVLPCHGIFKESMSGTFRSYRRPKLKSVHMQMQSREHRKSEETDCMI